MIDLLDEITRLPVTPNYSSKDRYADFHRLFTQDEMGRRVLREILSWGGLFKVAALGHPVDPYLSHIRIGEHKMAVRLLDAVYIEPPEVPVKQQRRKMSNG